MQVYNLSIHINKLCYAAHLNKLMSKLYSYIQAKTASEFFTNQCNYSCTRLVADYLAAAVSHAADSRDQQSLLCLFFTYYAMLQGSKFSPIMVNIMLM